MSRDGGSSTSAEVLEAGPAATGGSAQIPSLVCFQAAQFGGGEDQTSALAWPPLSEGSECRQGHAEGQPSTLLHAAFSVDAPLQVRGSGGYDPQQQAFGALW